MDMTGTPPLNQRSLAHPNLKNITKRRYPPGCFVLEHVTASPYSFFYDPIWVNRELKQRRRLGIFFLPKNHYSGNLTIYTCQSKGSTFPTVLPVLKLRYSKAFVEPSILPGIRPTINCKIRNKLRSNRQLSD